MQRILIPIDFSDTSLKVLQIGQQLSQNSGGELVLLHVVEPVQSYVAAADGMYVDSSVEKRYIDYLKENAESHIQNIRDKEEFKGSKLNTVIEIGNFFDSVRKNIDEMDVDLVLMGTEGAEGLEEILVGSNTEKIVRLAQAPVLAVKSLDKPFELNNIVFATNLKADQLPALKYLQKMQKVFNSTIHLLFVNTPANFLSTRNVKEKVENLVKQIDLENYEFHTYNELTEELGIINFSEDINADLITLATHQRSGLSHFLSGSIAEDIVNHAKQAVLTFGMRHVKS